MRYVYFALIIIFMTIIALFMFQNIEPATVSFLSASLTLPISVLVLLFYVLGMLTGGVAFSLLRTWIHGATKKPEQVEPASQ